MSRLTPIRTGEEVRMRSRAAVFQLSLVLLLGIVLFASFGCAHTYIPGSPSTTYWGQRVEDMMDMGDFGLTLSIKPGIALYKGLPPILTIGYGHVDGLFVGLGGGKNKAVIPRGSVSPARRPPWWQAGSPRRRSHHPGHRLPHDGSRRDVR